jgi:UDP-4-amino-4,6-dideoxy-N-acetyl-beta-L-altrosamine transaminase
MIKISYAKQYILEENIKAISKVLRSDFITQGPQTYLFQTAIKSYCNSKYCVTMNSASSALLLSCKVIGVKKGDIIWIPTNTYAATANCVLELGAKVEFIDIDINNFNISIKELKEKLNKAKKLKKLPKAIIPVHFAGKPVDMKNLYELKKKYKFSIIEDASHAIGASYKKGKVGNCKFSDITVFSFHPVKIITTGEGGAITTNNKNYYERFNLLINNGITKNKKFFKSKKQKQDWYYEQHIVGGNYRMSDIQSTLGLSQLKHINKFLKWRRAIAKIYFDFFKKFPNIIYKTQIDFNSSFHLFPILFKHNKKIRDDFYIYLKKKGINTKVMYIPLYKHPLYKNKSRSEYINSEFYYKNIICLPMHYALTKKNINYILKTIKFFLNKYEKK